MILQISFTKLRKFSISSMYIILIINMCCILSCVFCLHQLEWSYDFDSLDTVYHSNWFQCWTSLAYPEWIPPGVYNSPTLLDSVLFFFVCVWFCIYVHEEYWTFLEFFICFFFRKYFLYFLETTVENSYFFDKCRIYKWNHLCFMKYY